MPPGARRDRRHLRGPRPAGRSRHGDRRVAPADPPRRQRPAPPAHRARRCGHHRRRRRRGHLRDRHAGPGVPRPRGGGRRARPRRPRPRAAHRHAVAPRGPQADRRLPRPARGRRTADARRRRRGLRGAGGPQPAGPHLPPGAAPRASGAHGLQPGRELPRPRAPPPGDDLDAPPRHAGRRDRQAGGPLRARRGRLRLDVVGRAAQRHHPCPGPVPLPQRRRRRLCRAQQPPAVRGDARLRRGPGVLRPREPDGPPRRGVRSRPRGGPPAQCHGHRRPADHRAGRRERGARGSLHPGDRGPADAGHAGRHRPRRRRGRRPDVPPGRCRPHRRRRPCAARRGVGRGDQEHDVLRGLRRLRHGPLPARRRCGHAQGRHGGGRAGLRDDRPADRPHRARRRRRRAGRRSTRRSARPGRRRPRARRG